MIFQASACSRPPDPRSNTVMIVALLRRKIRRFIAEIKFKFLKVAFAFDTFGINPIFEQIERMLKIFDLSLKLNGFPIDQARKKLSGILAVPEADYAVFIAAKKREIVAFHQANNPFYQSIAGVNPIKNWNDVPIIKKADLQRPLAERLSAGYSPKNVFINKTSGSSGDPMTFAKDKYCHALIWANIM